MAVRAANMYGSVNGFTKVLKKLYGPTENGTRLVFQGFGRLAYDYGTLTYYTDNTYTTTATLPLTSQEQVNNLGGHYNNTWTVDINGVSVRNDRIKEIDLSTAVRVTTLPSAFLYKCAYLTKIIMPPNLLETPWRFLAYCERFNDELIFPARLQEISDEFMIGCSAFNQDLNIPSSVSRIGLSSFLFGCVNMTSTIDFGTIPASVSYDKNSATLSTDSSSSPSYINGIKIAGTYRSDWLAQLPNLPNGTVTDYYRNLIDAGH
jgi:hypothetical protein